MKYRVWISNHAVHMDSEENVRMFKAREHPGLSPGRNISDFSMTIPAILDADKDTSGFPYSDETGGWASLEAFKERPTPDEWGWAHNWEWPLA